MNTRSKVALVLCIVCVGMFSWKSHAEAAKPLAKITSLRGEVFILADARLTAVSSPGAILNGGNTVQTRDGQAEVTFDDGSIMKVSPYTCTMMQEREEESGWIFKTKKMTRRLTVLVGKLWFSSGASHTKNFLQTPAAVCGLRGSVAEIGYDNVNSFLNIISGGADTIGQFVRGAFGNPGRDAALKNNVYQALVTAGEAYALAQQTGDALDMAKAELSGLEAIKAAAEALINNPDPIVAGEAAQALIEVNARIEEKKRQIEEGTITPTSTVIEETTVEEMTTTATYPALTLPPPTIPMTTTTIGVSPVGR